MGTPSVQRINSSTAGAQRSPSVAVSPTGSWLVAFESPDANGVGVYEGSSTLTSQVAHYLVEVREAR